MGLGQIFGQQSVPFFVPPLSGVNDISLDIPRNRNDIQKSQKSTLIDNKKLKVKSNEKIPLFLQIRILLLKILQIAQAPAPDQAHPNLRKRKEKQKKTRAAKKRSIKVRDQEANEKISTRKRKTEKAEKTKEKRRRKASILKRITETERLKIHTNMNYKIQ